MDANEELIEGSLVYDIAGCALAVHNAIGHGLREKTYERALCVEFEAKDITFTQQAVYPVYYRDVKVDDYIPDLIIEERVIVDTKTVEKITDEHRGQMINYLRITGLEIGLIINFKHPRLQWERVVLNAEGRA
jgi:GxxExxY protein